MIDQSGNLEQEVAVYIRQNQLTNVDYLDNHRVGYYVNHDISDLINEPNKKILKHKLIKTYDDKQINSKFIVKKFPEQEPKFILIKND